MHWASIRGCVWSNRPSSIESCRSWKLSKPRRRERKAVEGVVSRPKQVVGHLPGYSTPRKLEWVVRGRGPLTLVTSCPRAGLDERRLKLG